jgi:hypothetical protein
VLVRLDHVASHIVNAMLIGNVALWDVKNRSPLLNWCRIADLGKMTDHHRDAISQTNSAKTRA